jgi:hypothetical protein
VDPEAHDGVVLQYDDHTVVTAGSEKAMGIYLAGTLGVLPKWLPAKAWESFRGDHFVIAAETAMMRREMKGLTQQSPPLVRAALSPISSLCEDSNWLGLGSRLNDTLAVHACAATKDADASARVRHTAEALKTLAQIAAQNARTQVDAGRQPNLVAARPLFDVANRLLDSLNLQQDGNEVRLRTSVEMDVARLGVLLSAIDATTKVRPATQDPSTKSGMMALVDDFFHHNFVDVTWRETIEWGDVTKTADGNFSIRYKYRAKIWDKEAIIINQIFTFDKQGKYVSVKDVMASPGTKEGMMQRVEDFFHHNYRDVTSRETLEWGEIANTKDGNCSIRYKYRARYWYGEPTIVNEIFTFNPKGQFVSVKDAEKHPPASPTKVYEVRKKVADFPDGEDLTTPEAAYASIQRAYVAEGNAAWPRLSVPALAAHLPGGDKRPLPTEAADRLLGTEILQVHVWDGIHAIVIAQEGVSGSPGSFIDTRSLTRVDGRWLNEGNGRFRTVDEARQNVEKGRSR